MSRTKNKIIILLETQFKEKIYQEEKYKIQIFVRDRKHILAFLILCFVHTKKYYVIILPKKFKYVIFYHI